MAGTGRRRTRNVRGATASSRPAAASRRCCPSPRACSTWSRTATSCSSTGIAPRPTCCSWRSSATSRTACPPGCRCWHVLSREQQGSELLFGRLDPDRLRRLLAAPLPVQDVDEWYVCGPFHRWPGAGRRCAPGGRPAQGPQPRSPSSCTGPAPPCWWGMPGQSARPGPHDPPRRAVRLQGRGLGHLSGPVVEGGGGDGRQLRARARRIGGGGRADLPGPSHDRHGAPGVLVAAADPSGGRGQSGGVRSLCFTGRPPDRP